jgi:pimeloyl-ACP methyl ester carboxylesterase
MFKSRYRLAMEAAGKRLAGGSAIVGTKLGDVEYSEYGEGPPVLISHGNGGGYDQGELIARNFLGSGFHSICPSRFGYLRTPLPTDGDASAEAQADAFASFLDTLGIPRAAVLAFSDGGPSALQFALRHPERCSALVLMAAKSSPPPPDTGLQAVLFNTMLRSDFLYWYMTYKFRPLLLLVFGVSREVQAHMTTADAEIVSSVVECMHPISLRKAGVFNDRKWLSIPRLHPRYYPLRDIKAPTLVVHAEDDGLQPFYHGQHTASNIPGARLLKPESGGHLLVGHIGEVRTEVMEFLKRSLG